MLRILAVLAPVFIAACNASANYPAWTIPVPEGTRIIDYPDDMNARRAGDRIELIEDLIISPRQGDERYLFYRPTSVAVDDAGRMYVLDAGDRHVRVFNAVGDYLRTLGREGEGPGELSRPISLATAGDRVLVNDVAHAKVVVWSTSGEHIDDLSIPEGRRGFLFGRPDGSFLIDHTGRLDDGTSTRELLAFSAQGERLATLVTLTEPPPLIIDPGGVRARVVALSDTTKLTVSADGAAYITRGDEYQVLAIAPTDRPRWALRVAWQRQPFTQTLRDQIVRPIVADFPDTDPSGTVWPTHLPALSRLAVDGHRHLFVFVDPHVPYGDPVATGRVNVFSASGERLFAGRMPDLEWTAARGDFVYGIRTDPETGNREPARYRLVEPFD